jgi:hypothetical protein
MGKNSKRLDLKGYFQDKVEDVIIHYRLRKKLTDTEKNLLYSTKYTLFNNLYAEVIVNYKLDKLDKI